MIDSDRSFFDAISTNREGFCVRVPLAHAIRMVLFVISLCPIHTYVRLTVASIFEWLFDWANRKGNFNLMGVRGKCQNRSCAQNLTK